MAGLVVFEAALRVTVGRSGGGVIDPAAAGSVWCCFGVTSEAGVSHTVYQIQMLQFLMMERTPRGDVFQLLAKACLIYYPCEHTRVLILKSTFTYSGVQELEGKGSITKMLQSLHCAQDSSRPAGTVLHSQQDRDFFTGESSSADFRWWC